jgi:hypothetical protein
VETGETANRRNATRKQKSTRNLPVYFQTNTTTENYQQPQQPPRQQQQSIQKLQQHVAMESTGPVHPDNNPPTDRVFTQTCQQPQA